MRRVRRVSPLPVVPLINSHYASSASAQMVQHRLGDFEAHAEALQPCRERPAQVMQPPAGTPDAVSSADLAFDQPPKGVPRWPGKTSASFARAGVGCMAARAGGRIKPPPVPEHGATDMRLDDHFGSGSTLQRNERVKLAASFWNNVGAGMVIVGMAGAFFLDKPPGTWAKIGIAIGGLVLGWLCYSIASNILR